jgi:hypothetical protein
MQARLHLWLGLVAMAAACTGADPYQGATAELRVADAQFYRGAPPEPTGGPAVSGLSTGFNRIVPGLGAVSFSGRAATAAQSVLINLQDDAGYWVVPTGPLDATEEGQRTFSARLGFARTLVPGNLKVLARAVDLEGRVGTPDDLTFVALSNAAQGALVVSLDWDADADLDLHVVMPNPDPAAMDPTLELWPKRVSSRKGPADGGAFDDRATIDFDSNAQCVIDGRRQENFVIKQAPPSGHYLVRVDTASLCAATAARWHLQVFRDGSVIQEARGIATPFDGYPAQGKDLMFGKDEQPGTAGAGLLAGDFSL